MADIKEEKATEKRALRHDFTAVEINDLSQTLAHKTKELAEVTEEKKTVSSQYAARLNEIKAKTNTLSNQITDGFEMRDIECDVEFNFPKQGFKTVTPRNGQKPIEEKMTDYEWNLFTQPKEDKETTELLDKEREKLGSKTKTKAGKKKK